jgi:hypothetical protein
MKLRVDRSRRLAWSLVWGVAFVVGGVVLSFVLAGLQNPVALAMLFVVGAAVPWRKEIFPEVFRR